MHTNRKGTEENPVGHKSDDDYDNSGGDGRSSLATTTARTTLFTAIRGWRPFLSGCPTTVRGQTWGGGRREASNIGADRQQNESETLPPHLSPAATSGACKGCLSSAGSLIYSTISSTSARPDIQPASQLASRGCA